MKRVSKLIIGKIRKDEERVIECFKDKGRYRTLRKLYFKERTKGRNQELEELLRDVDYLVAELHRVERRVGVYDLVHPVLRDLLIQLLYWENRKKYKSDQKIFEKLSEQFYVVMMSIYGIVFKPVLLTTFWINEENEGKEEDYYITEDAMMKLPAKPVWKDRDLNEYNKKELIDIIVSLM